MIKITVMKTKRMAEVIKLTKVIEITKMTLKGIKMKVMEITRTTEKVVRIMKVAEATKITLGESNGDINNEDD